MLLLLASVSSSTEPRSPAARVAQAGVGPAAGAGPMDAWPPRRTRSPTGRYEAQVDEARSPRLDGRILDERVDPRLRFSADEAWLSCARDAGLGETEPWRVALPDGLPEPVVPWPGTADRPSPSPDGRCLAFVSGTTGIAALWRVPLDGPLPVPLERGRQLSNHETRREPGRPPEGFLPPPTSDGPDWDGATLRRTAGGRACTLPVPP